MIARLCLVVCASLVPALALAQDRTFEYRVQPGDSCASIARRFFGSSRAYDRIHRLNDLGPEPHHLSPGTVLVLPTPLPEGPEARVRHVRGDVRSRPPGGAPAPARVGEELRRGHQVETGAESGAGIAFRDGSSLEMRENTLVIVFGGAERLASASRRATLERGALRSRLAELSDELRVETPSAVATLGEADTVVTVAADGASRVANLRGRAATVAAAGERMRVPEGTGTLVRTGGRPSPPRPLPPAPALDPAQATRFVGLTGRGATLSVRWAAVPRAARYRIEVARERNGDDVVAALEIPATVTAVDLARVPSGVYHVSIATIDEELFEGPPSERREVQVLEARIIAPGGGEPAEEPYDPGDPSEPARPPTVLPGTWIVAPVGYACGPPGEPPRGLATVRGRGLVQVRCVDPGGRPVPSFAVALVPPVVELVDAHGSPLERRTEVRVALRVTSAQPLPARLVGFSPDRDVRVGRVAARPDGTFEVPVTAGFDAPSQIAVAIGVAEGNDRVEFGRVSLEVAELEPADTARGLGTGTAEPPEQPPAALALFELFPQPASAPLIAFEPRGFEVRGGATLASDADGDLRARFSAGARAALPGTPVRVRFDWVLDSSATLPVDPAFTGSFDVQLGAAALTRLGALATLAVEGAAWVPTKAAESGLANARLLPSVQLAVHPVDRVALRCRQGLVAEIAEQGALLWASAYGVDVRVADVLFVGAEVDVSVGREGGADVAGVGLGGGATLRLPRLDVGLSVRGGLADGPLIFGALGGTLSVRGRFGVGL